MSQVLISFRQVCKRFAGQDGKGAAQFAVKDLTFDVAAGELVAVVGRTGCGKSTMFNLLAGLLDPTSGEVRVEGRDPYQEFDWLRGKIAVVFQNDRLLPWRSAIENVAYGLELLKRTELERLRIARDWLARLGLQGH